MSKQPSYINLSSIGKPEIGYITVAEYEKGIPFQIKRVYWTYYTPNEVLRGNHAHKELEQCIFAISGKIKFTLVNKDGVENYYELDKPDIGLYIPPMHWRTIKFSHNAVLLCLASKKYDENDYFRKYDEFLNFKEVENDS